MWKQISLPTNGSSASLAVQLCLRGTTTVHVLVVVLLADSNQ